MPPVPSSMQVSFKLLRSGVCCPLRILPGMMPIIFLHHWEHSSRLDQLIRMSAMSGWCSQLKWEESLDHKPDYSKSQWRVTCLQVGSRGLVTLARFRRAELRFASPRQKWWNLLGGTRLSRPPRRIGLSIAIPRARQACPSNLRRDLLVRSAAQPWIIHSDTTDATSASLQAGTTSVPLRALEGPACQVHCATLDNPF